MDAVRFLLDGEVVEAAVTDPTRTVLQFLREDLRRVGSKEGCAEGDCGACAVVVVELEQDALRYRAVNACIRFLPTLDGKALFTVESLKSRHHESPARLHPAQQSMVDWHGSQCGFCTPGFVMSMFALYLAQKAPTRAQINDALSGNLCRCTGYRPIIDACIHMRDYPAPRHGHNETALKKQLRGLARDQRGLEYSANGRRFFAPRDADELAAVLQDNPDAQILAGGTDVGLWVTKQLRELPHVVYLGEAADLNRIDIDDKTIRIAAAVTLEDALAPILAEYPELGELFRRFASLPVRNAGTLVGNVANGSPIGDSMPALLALGAAVNLRRGKRRRRLALEEFYHGYMQNALQAGEFIESVAIPRRVEGLRLACYKLSKRYDQDISALCAAFALRLDNELEGGRVRHIRIAFGGMAAIPKRALATEIWLGGKAWGEATIEQAARRLDEDFTPLGDMRASAAYRARAAANMLRRFFLQTRPEAALADAEVNVFQMAS